MSTPTTANRSNWAGNYTYQAARLHQPTTVAQVQELVRQGRKVRALGSRHSFNDIADTPGDLIALVQLAVEPVFDPDRLTVTIEAGVRYGQVARQLHATRNALPN